MQFGTNSAFGAFPTATAPRPRRQAYSGSSKEDSRAATHSSSAAGPQPIDRPNATPSLGRWSAGSGSAGSVASGEQSNGFAGTNGSASMAAANGHSSSPSDLHNTTRSFSSILSPVLPPAALLQSFDPNKPFVYSRDFLLSLYDEDKARKRPIELAVDELGTREVAGKPWALSEWREGEKELFATSIHPIVTRTNNRSLRLESNSTSNTLDLSTLAILPRDRDRALSGVVSSSVGRGSLGAGIGNTQAEAESASRRARTSISGDSSSATLLISGFIGGVLGGLGTPSIERRTSFDESGSAARSLAGSLPGSLAGTKEVWQGGRWRRGGTAELMDADDRAAPRRYGSQDALDPILTEDSIVPSTWEENDEPMTTSPSPSAPLLLHRDTPHQPISNHSPDPELEKQGRSIMGLLARDTHPSADALQLRSPPGLAPIATLDSPWQYRDPTGVVQGPFPATMMHDWYRQSFFSGDLCVRRVNEADFETLEALVRRSGDGEKPFLSASLQPFAAPVVPASAPVIPAWAIQQQSLDQFGNQQHQQQQQQPQHQQRSFESFYEQPTSFDSPQLVSQQQQHQQQQQQQPAFGLDPWGAPLPASNTPGWSNGVVPSNNDANSSRFAASTFQQQYQQQYQQPQQQLDPFSRAQPSYFDANQSTPAADWQQSQEQQQQQHLQQQHHQQQQLQQQESRQSLPSPVVAPVVAPSSWASLVAPISVIPTAFEAALPSVAAIPAPIGPPSSQNNSPRVPFDSPKPTATASAWGSTVVVAVAQPEVSIVDLLVDDPVAPGAAVAVPADAQFLPHQLSARPAAVAKAARTAAATAASTVSVETPVATLPSKPTTIATPAPWTKDEDASPSTPTGPSLRQIQAAESRQAEIRKASERQAAARIQALAAVQAAQRAAAAEAETLPSSSTWAAAPSAAAAPAPVDPWGKKSVSGVGKSMKDIQVEEELRRQQVTVVAATSVGVAAGTKGYAGSIGQTKALPGAPWSTVAVKPVSTPAPVVLRPTIPGGPIPTSSSSRSVSASSTSAAASVARSMVVSSPIRPITPIASSPIPARPTSISRTSSTYDIDSPPPPSGEFMKWCREALKGLTVPMDEFIQMLLSFPIEASSDVLEIISDSVYANSSTLDGRRFANDFSSRRKLDVSARFPALVMSKGVRGKPSSMAEALKQQPIVKAPEWSVKVASSKKKKGGQ